MCSFKVQSHTLKLQVIPRPKIVDSVGGVGQMGGTWRLQKGGATFMLRDAGTGTLEGGWDMLASGHDF